MPSSTPAVDVRFEIRLQPDNREEWTRIAYDKLYRAEGIRQLDSFYRWILSLLQPVPGRTLLDVACGEGIIPFLGAKLHGLRTYGSDLSLSALHLAHRESTLPFAVASGEQLPFIDGWFDYVTCIGSLEHFIDMHAGVQEMVRVLKPEGVACILVPNTYSILGNVYKALKTGMSTVDMQPLQRYAARREWAMLLESEGFVVQKTVKYEREWPLTLSDTKWYLWHPRELIKLALTPIIPLNLASCFVYLCKPVK